ncbi:MAG: 50S ribosomal protein L18 [Armatimonadetes bacterium]|nr:50S ribosomal protein L18 [Armatimonadota bacterium]
MQRRQELRLRRHQRVRNKLSGTPERPRLAVYRSLNHIYAQVIDDTTGRTLVAASSLDKDLRERLKNGEHPGGSVAAAREVGRLVGERAKARGVERVVFDRGGFQYQGRVAALADAAREVGLQF